MKFRDGVKEFMNQLSTVQLLYLLAAKAYSDGDTVTKSAVKFYLSKELQKDVEYTRGTQSGASLSSNRVNLAIKLVPTSCWYT